MLTSYIEAAMRHARFERLPDDESWYYGEIPELRGVWANAPSREDCCRELREVLEGWLILSLRSRDPLPVIDGISLAVEDAA